MRRAAEPRPRVFAERQRTRSSAVALRDSPVDFISPKILELSSARDEQDDTAIRASSLG
jgi:hypothetical protein